MSRIVWVAKSFKGSPLRPPLSDFCRLFSVSGRDVVVFETIKPSTSHYKALCKNIVSELQNTVYMTGFSLTLTLGRPTTAAMSILSSSL